MKEFFSFENKDFDIPFYRDNPKLTVGMGLLLLFALIVDYLVHGFLYLPILSGAISCIILITPVLYCLNWDYKAIFRKPTMNDMKWAVAMALLYIIYATIIGTLFDNWGIAGNEVALESSGIIMELAEYIFFLMGEEFIKIISFILVLTVTYKLSHNRKASIVVAAFIALMIFGLEHVVDFRLIYVGLFIQGLGSVVHLFLYVKTKNVFVSYISHILTDVLISLMGLLYI